MWTLVNIKLYAVKALSWSNIEKVYLKLNPSANTSILIYSSKQIVLKQQSLITELLSKVEVIGY